MIGWLLATALAIPPPGLAGAGVDERVGRSLSGSIVLEDPQGARFRAVDRLEGRPTLLALGWFRCVRLCRPTLQAALASLDAADVRLGRDADLWMVSLDPTEDARDVVDFVHAVAVPDAVHLLRGAPHHVGRLAADLGVRARHDPQAGWIHPAVLVVLTPEGRVSRYLYGLRPDVDELREALRDARAERGVPSPVAALVSTCLPWTDAAAAHGGTVLTFLRVGGITVLFGVLGGIGVLFARAGRR